MLVARYNPYGQMREFRKGFNFLNTMLDEIHDEKSSTFKDNFSPTVNTREGEFAYHVEVDLPGIKKEDVDIKVEDNTLLVSGERKVRNEVKEDDYYKVESSFGTFSRSFSLPNEIDIENIRAESENGVLEVIIPKLKTAEVDKVKKIEIK